MADQEGGRELPHRVRGAARGGSASTAPVLSEEVRQRIQAAVRAERAERTDQDQELAGEPAQRAAGSGPASGTTGAAANEINAKPKHGAVKPEPGNKPDRGVRPEAAAKGDHVVRASRGIKPEHSVEGDRDVKSGHSVRDERALTSGTDVSPGHTAKPGQDGNPGHDNKREHVGRHDRAAKRGSAANPQSAAPSRPSARRPAGRGARIAVLALALVAIGLSGAVVGLGMARPSAGGQNTAALEHQELVARTQAASWVVQQVDHTAVVSCDPAMCTALAKDGFPARKLVVLGSASPTVPVNSQVVIVTAEVRDWFGSSLAAAYAPAVLASFASGSAQVSVRVMAPHGVGAYDAASDSDVAQRKLLGKVLLNAAQVTIAGPARQQLAAGQVDLRLVLAIRTLAGALPIDIVRFGNPGPGASADLPLRFADLAGNDQAAQLTGSLYRQAVHAAVNAGTMVYVPDKTVDTVLPGHGTVIQVEFTAPSAFGLPSGH
jgi:hypothetical protein